MNFMKGQRQTYATFHGSGPRTLKNVSGFIVPAPTCLTFSEPQKLLQTVEKDARMQKKKSNK